MLPILLIRNWGTETLRYLLEVTQLVSGRAWFQTQEVGSRVQVLNHYEYCLQK